MAKCSLNGLRAEDTLGNKKNQSQESWAATVKGTQHIAADPAGPRYRWSPCKKKEEASR